MFFPTLLIDTTESYHLVVGTNRLCLGMTLVYLLSGSALANISGFCHVPSVHRVGWRSNLETQLRADVSFVQALLSLELFVIGKVPFVLFAVQVAGEVAVCSAAQEQQCAGLQCSCACAGTRGLHTRGGDLHQHVGTSLYARCAKSESAACGGRYWFRRVKRARGNNEIGAAWDPFFVVIFVYFVFEPYFLVFTFLVYMATVTLKFESAPGSTGGAEGRWWDLVAGRLGSLRVPSA